MADQTKTGREEHDGVCAKAQELLAQFSSTVFAFDTSKDTRYITCDFPQCKQHAEALQGKRCWLLNTMRNVKVLERHVGKEVHDYMKEKDSGTDDQVLSPHYIESQGLLEKQQLPERARKVLAVFNLKDPQSQFGDWISLFFKAAFMAEGMRENDCVVITQNFVSRQELMECIAKLKFLNSHRPTVEVVIVLSCHSSCQGQVFSCTPFAVGKQCGFEEFCSLHDFVMACQSVLKDILMAIHISSCFTLKLDCSHAEWPVEADWLKTKLHSILCGSTKEVYETGSQVADLHLMLSTMIPSIPTGTCGTRLRDAVNKACYEGFPDLAREMGLGFLGSDNVDERLLTEGHEDEVTPPGLVMSSMRVVFLVEDEIPATPFQEPDNSKQSGSYVVLADALVANLQMRKASDVKFEFMILQMKHGETSLESMRKHLDLLPHDSFKVLFVALGPMFSRPNLELIKLIMEWNDKRTGGLCYGIHFQHVTAMQAYVIKNRLKEIQGSEVPGTNMEKTAHGSHLAVTGLIENDNRNCAASFPVLLYMIHLAVGENGNRLAGKGIPSAVYSKKPVGHGMSSWTLEEVYMETCHVLSGLSSKCGLHLLSPALNPVQTTSATSTFPRGVLATLNEPSALESANEGGTNAVLVACGPPSSAPHKEPADLSCNFTFPTNECEITRDGNPLELFHRDDENIDVFNENLVTGNEPSIAMCLDKQPSKIGAVIMDTSFSQENMNNRVSGSDCQPLTANEVSVGTIPSIIMAAEGSSVGTGNIDVSMFNITSVSPIGPFEDVSILADEEGDRMKDEDRVDEGPGRVTCYDSSSLIFGPPSATSSLQNHVSVQDREQSTTKLFEHGDVFSELSGHQVTFQEKPSSTANPCSAIPSVSKDAGLLELDECSEKLVSDENGLSVLDGHVPYQEKSSSTINPCSAVISVRNYAGLLDLDECTTNLANEENGISVLSGHVPFHEKSSLTIDPFEMEARLPLTEAEGHNTRLVDEVNQLREEPNVLTSLEKPSSVISPVGEIAIPPQEEGSANKPAGEEDRLGGQENDVLCEDKKPCSPISTGAVLSADEGSTANLDNEADGLEEPGHEMYHENPSSTTSAIVTTASMSLVEGNAMKLAHDEDKSGEEPDDEEQFLIYGTAAPDVPSPQKRSKTKIDKKTTATKSHVKVDTPFQTWLQNFTTFCKKQNEVEQKQTETNEGSFEDSNSQGAPSNFRRKKRRKKTFPKDCIPGNLESCNISADIQTAMETDCIPSANVYPSMSEFTHEDLTGDHMGSSDNEQIVLESDSLNSGESVLNRVSVFEVMECMKPGIDNVEDDQSEGENALGSAENREMEIDSEDTYAGSSLIDNSGDVEQPSVKKLKNESEPDAGSLLIDNSGDVEQHSEKKLKNESESECKESIKSSLDTNWDKSEDLPLMANVDEVLVHHYILDLSVKFNEKIMKGNIVLFLEPCNEEVTKKQFQMTLDSSLVNIESVSEVTLPDDYKVTFCGHKQNSLLEEDISLSGVRNGFLGDILGDKSHTPLPFKGLSYSVYGWCVQIWKPGATGKAWPRCVWIKYHTSPEGTSLTWATDQDGKPSVFSPGAYINNRSLMPCQEPPVAMSTWQASIHVPEGCVVLMSGNEFVGKTTGSDDQVTYHYEMDCPLPCSTLAVAVGWWQYRQSQNAETKNGSNPDLSVTCRLFAPPSLIDMAANELLGYAPKFLEASCELLGPYPFKRLDMLVLPKCFACMGLKSPNLVFLSQSLLSGDASMRVRLAHEISHAWFGLLVGAKDWSEEWLSEGFATFIEEKIQSKAERWSKDKDRFFREIRQILRHRCLLSEIRECDDSLKCLRPKTVKPASALSTAEAVKTRNSRQSETIKPHTVVQFGQICSRKWTQIHYLKGYFLLHRLASLVGLDEFDEFLFNYVQHFKGQLVASEDFFEFFIESFSNVPRETTDKLVREWLERAGMPKSFPKKFDSPDNELVSQVENEFQTWKKQDSVNKRNKTLKVRKRKKPPNSSLEVAEQVVLLLEKLLERETISHSTLRQLEKCYNLSNGNAEIRHRWCELVVKHNYTPALQEVQRFLVEDQGMGIYLFGELIISQQPKQRALVDEVLKEIGPEMDRCTYRTVKDMLEGND